MASDGDVVAMAGETSVSAEAGGEMSVPSVEVDKAPSSAASPAQQSKLTAAKKWFLKNFLPCMLIFTFLVAVIAPAPGIEVASWRAGDFAIVQTILVAYIFFFAGLGLKTDDVRKALSAGSSIVFGVVSILGLTPLLALVPAQFPTDLLDANMQTGFILFCCMPTTLNSGVALVVAGDGNAALALFLTVFTNILGVFTAPLLLSVLLGVDGVTIDALPILAKLSLMLLLPLVVGKILRHTAPKLLAFSVKYKQPITLSTHFALALIPWMKVSTSAESLGQLPAHQFVFIVLASVLVHCVFLLFNGTVAALMRWPEDMRRAVIIMCSQKTLPVAMAVLALLPPAVGEPGMIAIPCILCHLLQILMDAVIVSRWVSKDAKGKEALETTVPHSKV